MVKDRIEIKKSLIPYSFNIALPDEIFTITINYNENADLFVVALFKDDEMICSGEPIIYGVPLFQDIYKATKYPAINIIPLDESGNMDAVTYDNFNETVFLIIDNGGTENE